MTSKAEIERLLNQTGRTLEGLPEEHGMSDVIELLVDALKDALDKQPKWTSVKEKLPKENQTVLVWADGAAGIAEIYDKDMINGEPVWSYTGLGSDPMYWMTLPNLLLEEGGEECG